MEVKSAQYTSPSAEIFRLFHPKPKRNSSSTTDIERNRPVKRIKRVAFTASTKGDDSGQSSAIKQQHSRLHEHQVREAVAQEVKATINASTAALVRDGEQRLVTAHAEAMDRLARTTERRAQAAVATSILCTPLGQEKLRFGASSHGDEPNTAGDQQSSSSVEVPLHDRMAHWLRIMQQAHGRLEGLWEEYERAETEAVAARQALVERIQARNVAHRAQTRSEFVARIEELIGEARKELQGLTEREVIYIE